MIKIKCPKCSRYMERRKHQKITKQLLAKAYYFSEWDVCRPCKHVQHYEKYKVYSKKKPSNNKWFARKTPTTTGYVTVRSNPSKFHLPPLHY